MGFLSSASIASGAHALDLVGEIVQFFLHVVVGGIVVDGQHTLSLRCVSRKPS